MYLDDVDYDEIKRRKRQSPFTKNQSEDKIISETIAAFKDASKNEEVETSKKQIHREKRQLTSTPETNKLANITLNSPNDLKRSHALPEKEEEQGKLCSSFLI